MTVMFENVTPGACITKLAQLSLALSGLSGFTEPNISYPG